MELQRTGPLHITIKTPWQTPMRGATTPALHLHPCIHIITRKPLRSRNNQQNYGQSLYRSENNYTPGPVLIPYNTVGWRDITRIWPMTARPKTLHLAASTIDVCRLSREDIQLSGPSRKIHGEIKGRQRTVKAARPYISVQDRFSTSTQREISAPVLPLKLTFP